MKLEGWECLYIVDDQEFKNEAAVLQVHLSAQKYTKMKI